MGINRSRSGVVVLAETNYTDSTQTVDAATLTGLTDYKSISFLLKIDVAAGHSAAGDKLQVYFQRSGNYNLNNVTATWDDIASSSLHTEASIGDGATLYEWVNIASGIEPGTSDDVYTEAADTLTAATTKDLPWGDEIRVRVTETEGTALDMSLTIWAIYKN